MSQRKDPLSDFKMALGVIKVVTTLGGDFVEQKTDYLDLQITLEQQGPVTSNPAWGYMTETQAMAKLQNQSTEMVTQAYPAEAAWEAPAPLTYEVSLENLEAEKKAMEDLGHLLDDVDHLADIALETMDETPEPEKPETPEPEKPQTGYEIGGAEVERQMAEIKTLQETHEQQLNNLHADRDKELAARAATDAALAENPRWADLGPGGQKMLEDAQAANQQQIKDRFAADETSLRQKQGTEMAALEAKQVAQQRPDAPAPPPPPPPPPPPAPPTRTF